MSTEEKPQVPKEPQQASPKETQKTPSGCFQETLLKESDKATEKIESESPGDGSDSHKWGNKMEVQRLLSSKPDLEIEEKRTVLFVDDDSVALLSIVRCLQDQPYNILTANGSKEALEILKQNRVHVIVTDMCMPEMNGLELLRAAKKDHPNIIGIVITGYELDPELQKAFDHGEVFKLIPKPWKLTENFKTLTQQAVDNYNLKSECKTIRL